MDPAFHWSDRDWWTDAAGARVVAAPGGRGFAIVGYGRHVDADVASEICELYCKDPWALLPLVRSCLPHLRWPFGFQVLVANLAARRAFERLLTRLRLPCTRTAALDGTVRVLKYRVAGRSVPP